MISSDGDADTYIHTKANAADHTGQPLSVLRSLDAQWQFGDWDSLRSIELEWVEQQDARAYIAQIIAVAHYQTGRPHEAEQFVEKALAWGASREDVTHKLLAGAFNSLGAARLAVGNTEKACKWFNRSVLTGSPGTDGRLLTPTRARFQAARLAIPIDASDSHLDEVRKPPARPVVSQIDDVPNENSSLDFVVRLNEILGGFADRLIECRTDLVVDGVKVFDQKDPFLSGKVANALAFWATQYATGSDITAYRCGQFKKVMAACKRAPVKSWGIYYYLKALQTLNEANVLTDCFTLVDLNDLRRQLDWRTFVNEENYALINRPNNFYGLAYSIAYLRYQLGWDNVSHSESLLEKELDHYEKVSGDLGFADDTRGKGRFDRYSFLLIAELANRFHESGLPLTLSMRKWLRASVEFVLFNANLRGDGFQYGRSIGAYADSAFMQILTAAALHGLLAKRELLAAYGFCQKITQKFLEYWWVEERKSINIWSNGRATDTYRGKHRILGENFSLLDQHINCQQAWVALMREEEKAAGLADNALTAWVEALPASKLTHFAKGSCNFAVFNHRCNKRMVCLPMVNGGSYYRQMAYQPIPFLSGLLHAIPNITTPILIPEIILQDNVSYIPYPCYHDIETTRESGAEILRWQSRGGTRIDRETATKDAVFDIHASLICTHSRIVMKQSIFLKEGIEAKEIGFVFPSFSPLLEVEQNTYSFKDYWGTDCELRLAANAGIENSGSINERSVDATEGSYEELTRFVVTNPNQSIVEFEWSISFAD